MKGANKMSNELNTTELATIPCCPPLDADGTCDVLDFHYRQIYNTTVQVNNQPVRVEVTLQTHLERCPGPLALGDLVYSTTLLPGEKVRLFTTDRRTQFSFDSASKVSYRHQQTSEERYYMAGVNNYMSDLTIRDSSRANNVSGGSFSSQSGTSGFFETLFSGPSVDVSGSYNAFSSSDFLREVSQHARSSHYRSEMATRAANSVSVGEVQTRTHTEGESEDHFESSSRVFANPNHCHAVTFLFYQINKTQTVKFTLESIRRRVIDPAADTRVTNKALVDRGEVSVIPNALLATDKERLEIEKIGRDSVAARNRGLGLFVTGSPETGVATGVQPAQVLVEPLPDDVRREALQQVNEQLIAARLLDENGNVSSEAQ